MKKLNEEVDLLPKHGRSLWSAPPFRLVFYAALRVLKIPHETSKNSRDPHGDLFKTEWVRFIDMNHSLIRLGNEVDEQQVLPRHRSVD
jgi:hypothetical protein